MLRFYQLDKYGLWIDESFFGFLIKSGTEQEFLPVWIGQLFSFHSEFWLRFQSALFGTLTIPAVYFVVKKYKIYASVLVAIFPLFIFWSRLARPYSVAGFFLVLSWRYWYFMIPAVLTTPIALIGILGQILQKKWKIVLLFLAIALIFYFIRPDSGREWTFEQIIHSPRWFYLPLLTFVLFFFDYLLPLLVTKYLRR